jgi:adenine-specific DNA-methyltransferase
MESLLLSCRALSSPTTCRFIPAHSVHDTIFFYAAPGTRRNEVLQAYDPDYVEQYYRYVERGDRKFMSADLSGAGAGPARRFGERGWIKPPNGRHWMYDQDGIDRLLREDRIF